MIRVGELCAGYGGLGMAVASALGATRTAWVAEVDATLDPVLKREHPGALNLGDIKSADFRAAERVDVMCAGVPCQPTSAAGRNRGADDDRWLWPWALGAIRAQRPGMVFFENVHGLVERRHRHLFDGVVSDLVECGYHVNWLTLGACAVGMPHHRHRVFLLAARAPRGTTPHVEHVTDVPACGAPRSGGRRLLPTPRNADARSGVDHTRSARTGTGGTLIDAVAPLLPTPAARDGDPRSRGEGSADYWERRAASGRTHGRPLGAVASLLPTPNATDARGGPRQPPERRTSDGKDHGPRLRDVAAYALLPSPRASDGSNGGPNQGVASGDLALSSAVHIDRWGKFAEAVALWERLSGIPAPVPTEPGRTGSPRLSALLPEWMMGLPRGYLTAHGQRADVLRWAGNGVAPAQAEAALRLLAGLRP